MVLFGLSVLAYLTLAGLWSAIAGLYIVLNERNFRRSFEKGNYDTALSITMEEVLLRILPPILQTIPNNELMKITEGIPSKNPSGGIGEEKAAEQAMIMANNPWMGALEMLGPEGRRIKKAIFRNPMTAEIYKTLGRKLVEIAPKNIREQFLPLFQAEDEVSGVDLSELVRQTVTK
jgi:hypothetical protein